ncbi:MAG: hypothetical protein H8K07_12525 [Nitrospira sp.]|jgi:hypothetical protein|nr:hypothetical protein [Nitrospira sp.]MDI3465558.1 hypothetical protein [Nitrospira sp.]
MNGDEKEDQRLSRGIRQKDRLDTQIHRRRKVKALSPLECEWGEFTGWTTLVWSDEQNEEMRH